MEIIVSFGVLQMEGKYACKPHAKERVHFLFTKQKIGYVEMLNFKKGFTFDYILFESTKLLKTNTKRT